MTFFEKFQKASFGHFHGSEPWDFAANFYDLSQPTGFWLLGATKPQTYKEFAHSLIQSLVLPEKPKIIDCACGTGYLHEAISQKIRQGGQCLAIDFSAGMLEKAYRKSKGKKRTQFTFKQINLYSLKEKIPANSFDGAFLSFTLPVLQDPQKALKNICNILKPGAGIAIATLSREIMDTHQKKHLWRMLVRLHQKRYLYQNELKTLLSDAGFHQTAFQTCGWTLIITAYRQKN